MMPALNAELRKLFSVRSTFILSGVVLLLVTFLSFWFGGYKANYEILNAPDVIMLGITGVVNTVAVIGALIAVLLVTHEYRYNTITYTLTASNSRGKVLLAKAAAVSAFAVGFTILVSLLTVGAALLGMQLQGADLIPQSIQFGDLLWRVLFFAWGYAMFGLLLAVLLRNQIATIVVLLIGPSTVEPLLALLLKGKSLYLPFSALNQVLLPPHETNYSGDVLSAGKAALVVLVYIATIGLVAWLLFRRRDAN